MSKGQLLARREAFGYLFIDRQEEWLFATHTDTDLDFTNPHRFQFRDPSGSLRSVRNINQVPSTPRRADRLSAPTYVELYPTMSCNERCYFCYAGDFLNNNGPQLLREGIRPLIDNIARAGVFQLVILGGEPFLYRHLPELLDEAAKTSMVVSLSTNATVDRDDVWERIIAQNVHVNLSVHSTNPEIGDRIVGKKGATHRVLAKIDTMAEAGISPHVSLVLTRDNIDDAVSTTRSLIDRGLTSISMFHTAGLGYATHHPDKCVSFRQFANTFEQALAAATAMGAVLTPVTNYPFLLAEPPRFANLPLASQLYGTTDGRRVLYILNDGQMLASLYGKPTDMTVGNALDDDLSTAWNASPVLDRIERLPLHAGCSRCKHYAYCRGGPLSNRTEHAVAAATPHCPVYVPDLLLE